MEVLKFGFFWLPRNQSLSFGGKFRMNSNKKQLKIFNKYADHKRRSLDFIFDFIYPAHSYDSQDNRFH